MTTSEWLAIWALIIAGATLLVYLGQLVVLILVYRRVIKETDRNAEERRQQIEKAGDMMIKMGKDMEQGLNGIAKRNTIGMALMGVILAVMVSVNRAMIYKIEKHTKQPSQKNL